MKIKLLTIPFLALSMGLTSCNLNTDEDNNYFTGNYSVVNLISPEDGAPFASKGDYLFTYYTYSENLSITTKNLNLGYNTLNFVTAQLPYSLSIVGPQSGFVFSGSGSANGASVSNLSGYTSSYVNLPPESLTDYPFYVYSPLVMKYTVNHDYTVRTFLADAIYNGNTSVTTQATGDVYKFDNALYRVIFHEDFKKADVIIINAKFAENMPGAITCLIKDLDVTFNKNGYSIDAPGKVIPYNYESNGWTSMDTRPFTSFHLNTSSDDLTNITVNYTVQMGPMNFICDFNGIYTQKIGQQEPK